MAKLGRTYAALRHLARGHRLGRVPGVRPIDRMARRVAARRSTGEFTIRGKTARLHPEVVLGGWSPLSGGSTLHEPITTEAFIDAIIPNTTVIDIGANAGYFSVIAACSLGASGRVVAFEPDPRVWPNLEWAARHSQGSIDLVRAAVAACDGTIEFHVGSGPASGSVIRQLVEQPHRIQQVDSVSVDSYLAKHPQLPPVSVVKIDVEGAELTVLEGMQELLSTEVTLIVCCDRCAGCQTLVARTRLFYSEPHWP